MKAAMSLVLLLAFVACRKDDEKMAVKLAAACRHCAVEFKDGDGVMHRDTMLGDVIEQPNPNAGDTTSGYAIWNIVLPDGGSIYFQACRLSGDTVPMTLTASGDIRPIYVTTDSSTVCASIDQRAMRP